MKRRDEENSTYSLFSDLEKGVPAKSIPEPGDLLPGQPYYADDLD